MTSSSSTGSSVSSAKRLPCGCHTGDPQGFSGHSGRQDLERAKSSTCSCASGVSYDKKCTGNSSTCACKPSDMLHNRDSGVRMVSFSQELIEKYLRCAQRAPQDIRLVHAQYDETTKSLILGVRSWEWYKTDLVDHGYWGPGWEDDMGEAMAAFDVACNAHQEKLKAEDEE